MSTTRSFALGALAVLLLVLTGHRLLAVVTALLVPVFLPLSDA